MNIGNKYLRSWLRFDESATKDFIADNQWQVYGNPTISTTNAISGKALQLDGNSYLKLSGVELAGRAFTLDCMAYVDASSPDNARLFSIVDSNTGVFLATVRKSATSSNCLEAWANSYSDYSANNGNTATITETTGVGTRVHVAIIYNPSASDNFPAIYIAVNGYIKRIITIYYPTYQRGTFDIVIGASPNGNQGLIGSIDEFRIYDGVYFFTDQQGHNFTPPDASSYNTHEFWTDTIRMPSIPASKWRYDNIGEIDTLINTTTAVQLTDLPATQSRTGKAFYQTTQTKIFDVASSKEVWVKFDVFFDGVNRWRAYDISTGSGITTGITAQTDGRISFFNRNTSKRNEAIYTDAKINALQTIILHMVADSSSGLIEAYTDDGGLMYAYTGEVNNGTNFSNLYLQSDGAGTFFSNIVISNSPLWFNDRAIEQITVDYLADAQREISRAETVIVDTERVVDRSWRYENYGTADLLKVTGNTVNNLPLNKSAIGMAFWQSGREGCFDIPATKELWAKWDLYYTGTAKWRVYDRKDSKDTGVARMNSTTSLVCYINGPLQVDVKPSGTITQGARKTYLLHMVSDATDGYIELWIDGVKYYSNNFQSQGLIYKGNVNDGDAFNNFYMQSDNNSNLFSNVIISNRQIGLNENVWDIVEADAERSLYRSELFDVDLVRAITVNSIPVNFGVDLCREISASQSIDFDTEREIAATYNFDVDCERALTGIINLSLDTERKVANVVTVYFDKEWGYINRTELLFDAEREIEFTVSFPIDLVRKIPYKITDDVIPPTPPEPSPGVVPPADKSAYLQSCTISLAEQQLTDNITFVFNGTCEIMDAVDFQLLDYALRGRVEETTTRGVMTTCKCTVDIDAVLYQQLAYSVPPNKWEYTEEYIDYVHSKGGCIRTDPGYEDADLKAIPSAPASAHITEIAAKLGKNVSLHFTDFISTMNTEVKSGTNYAGLLQELFGWTSRLPHMMINCYLRGNTIYVVQRGQEQNTVTLDGQKLTVHTVNKKLVRTTWGSDPWSKTEVKPYFNDWTEGVKEPLPDEGGEGGAEYNDDGLVEETTVQHGDETVVTHYYYETLENGQKFLYQEVATTYNNGSKVDEVTTYHDPVRDTQSHVYSVDSDGVLGGVVTSSNNDDRRTPWQNAKSSFQGGILVSDMDGNRYLLKEIIYHHDEGEKAHRTINGVSLIDTSFPVEGESTLQALTNAIMWLDRKTEETVTVEVYNYPHLIDFNDKIVFGGNTYYLRSNNVTINERIVNRQSLEFVRWY